MTKGICDLRKFLHKAQVRLTQAGSLIIGYLRKMVRIVRGINKLRDSYTAQTPQNRFRQIGRASCRERVYSKV
jgi:hypothetical protein